jgi:succinate-semialdehyde dehydrogenase/glutarate-semialdehyde dehydrogenase
VYRFSNYIDGELVQGAGRLIPVMSPGTGQQIGEIVGVDKSQAEAALEAAKAAFPSWSALTLEQRGEWMKKLAAAVVEEQEQLAEIMAWETGKFIRAARGEVAGLPRSLDFFLTQARSNFDETIHDPAERQLFLSVREPLGVIVAYIAWNFPMGNLSMKLGAVLASGCTAVIKPATLTPLSTLYLGEIMHRIGFPRGVINFVAGTASEVATVLTRSTIPAMVTLIGSSAAGRELIRDSSTSIKRFSLELGGNAPVVVTPHGDVRRAAIASMRGKMFNGGQICTSPQRALVHSSVVDDFVAAASATAADAHFGSVHDAEANVGPMITPQAVDRMERLVADAVEKGATLVAGGRRPPAVKQGNFFEPTILTNVTQDMLVWREEIFGPILAVKTWDDLDQAIALANDTEYGLYSYVWSRDIVEANAIARRLHFGSVSINGGGGGISVPHGGVKESGVGKDGSKYGLDEYYYIKSIRLNLKD